MTSINTFFFTKEQGLDIILKDSLLTEEIGLAHDDGVAKLLVDLKKLKEKECKLDLHAVTLSDYWRTEIIPRGLRIKKFPSIGNTDDAFKQKWEAVLNKCSLDLILLLIEEAKTHKSGLQEEIKNLESKICLLHNQDQINTQIKKLEEDMAKFTDNLRKIKISKLRRDQRDYKEKRVYYWPEFQSHFNERPRRARSVSFNLPSSDDGDSGSVTSGTDQSFLDVLNQRGRPRRNLQGGGGSGRGQTPQRTDDGFHTQRRSRARTRV